MPRREDPQASWMLKINLLVSSKFTRIMPRSNDLPDEVRWRIVDLHKAGKGYKLIAKTLGLHQSTVRQVVYKWKRFNTVVTLPRRGRPTKKERDSRQPQNKDNSVPDDGEDAAFESSNTKATDQDTTGSVFTARLIEQEGDAGHDMNECNIILDDSGVAGSDSEAQHEEYPYSHSSAKPADDRRGNTPHSMADNVSAAPADSRGADPHHSLHRAESSWESDEPAEEDPMDSVFDSDFKGEQKIYAGSAVTTGSLFLLLMIFILKHGLSKAATKDLLDLLNFVVPGCVPKSARSLKKHISDSHSQTETHFYCPGCKLYLGVDPSSECGVCQHCLNRKSLLEKAYYFLVMPVENQLRNILTDFHSKLGKHLTRDFSISDINTGGEHKRETRNDILTLTFTCDGSPVSSSSEFSVWTIMCTINELPYVERCKNVLLHALWFGRGKPHMQSFFTPFIQELQKLSTAGFIWRDGTGSEHHTRVTAKICNCDSVPRSVLQNFNQFNEEFGCGFCYQKGDIVKKGNVRTRVYPVRIDGCDLRHMAETEQIVQLVLENNYKEGQMGIKGPSLLLPLLSFDVIKGFVPDYIHCFCLGVVPQFVNLWFDPLSANKDFHLTPQHLNDLNTALSGIQPPEEVRQRPRSLSERMHWKPSEWRAFALLYSPLLLKNVLPALYYEHWMLLVSAFHILLSDFASQNELSCAELCLVQFVAKIQILYGHQHCSYNCHLLTHLSESARDWGLSWATSGFVFEDTTNRLLQVCSGTQDVSSRILKHFFSYETVLRKGRSVLEDTNTETRDFFCSMTGCEISPKSPDDIEEHLVTLGSGSSRVLMTREIAALQDSDTYTWNQHHQENVTEYNRCLYKSLLISTMYNSAATQRNNSVIQTTSGFAVVESLVVVEKSCSCEGNSRCSCREVVAFCKQMKTVRRQVALQGSQVNNDITNFMIQVKHTNELCAVTSKEIIAKCFAVEHESQVYVMRMPVFEPR